MTNMRRIAILAGSGHLPRLVYDACQSKGFFCHIIGLEGQISSQLFPDVALDILPMHAVSAILQNLRQHNITHITLAGRVERTNIAKLLLDKKGIELFKIIVKRGLQDNNILTSVIKFLEQEGFEIIPPNELAPNILTSAGSLTLSAPSDDELADITNGMEILRGIAQYDVGQALIIQSGLVLGVEAAEGTDELIKRCASLQQNGLPPAILVKIAKPTQDRRVDLPCIGVNTIKNIKKSGLRGIAVEADSCLLLDAEQTLKSAEEAGIFIFGASRTRIT